MYLTAHQARILQDPQLDKQFHTTLDAIKLAAELGRDSLILEGLSTSTRALAVIKLDLIF
jgi:hypothetical protein